MSRLDTQRGQPVPLVARLDRSARVPLLTGGARALPERQQTIHGTIAWSHDLLTPAEQRLFQRLAVFVGGFTLDAAEAVGGKGAEGGASPPPGGGGGGARGPGGPGGHGENDDEALAPSPPPAALSGPLAPSVT